MKAKLGRIFGEHGVKKEQDKDVNVPCVTGMNYYSCLRFINVFPTGGIIEKGMFN